MRTPLPAVDNSNQQQPKVFISYSHDSGSHREGVRKLAERLIANGIDVTIDLWINGTPDKGWPLWMTKSLKASDFVLVVCTKTYYERAMDEAPDGQGNGKGQGVKWESLLFNSHIYTNDSRNKKYIPVFLADADIKLIPDGLRSFTYYSVDDDDQYMRLYRYLTNQPEYVKPQPGSLLKLDTKKPFTQSDAPANESVPTPIVDLSAMPTSSGTIVGRESEVEWLNKAWDDPKSRVVSVIAWGGVGKTSLINYWLNKMSENDFNGAARVFAHSFYSQGTSDQRNVSAEHFMADAFRFLNFTGDMPQSSHEKGLLLAELFCQQRTLLVLDGLEPMQHPPGVLKGKLKDSALEVFIKQLAFNLNGLCVITSRVPVYELENRGEQYELQSLSVEAGIEVLNNFAVTGPKQDMQNAVEEVHGHALTLSLLGGYLSEACDGDIRKRDTIPNLIDEPNEGEHAKHVMHSYQVWLEQTERFEDVNILFIIALFDRPVEMTTVNALLAGDEIIGITDKLKTIPTAKLKFAIKRLMKLQLISDGTNCGNSTLDCHPLVREHFANTLKTQNPLGYQQAHQRLYEYYKKLPEDELPNTLDKMQPLFNAISHGCKAGMYQQALDEVYWPRISRGDEAFIVHKLGSFAADLSCLANFFLNNDWSEITVELSIGCQAGIYNWVSFDLSCLGRLWEALRPIDASLSLRKRTQDWRELANNTRNLSDVYLHLGDVNKSIEYGKESVEYASKLDDFSFHIISHTTHASALLQRGLNDDISKAQALFMGIEQGQQRQSEYPYLYSLQGYRYCQLLLAANGRTLQVIDDVIQRVKTTIEWAISGDLLFDIALDQLTLGKAYLLKSDFTQARSYLNLAVKGLRKAGQIQYLPSGLIARTTYYIKTNNHQAAWRDLDETFEIATFGDMCLYLCDYHIEACRNIAVQLAGNGEAYIVIKNGQTIHPSKTQMIERMNEHFEIAKAMIDELPYHWRDDDLVEVKTLISTLKT